MRDKWVVLLFVVSTLNAGGAAPKVGLKANCRRVVIEGDVKAGQSFERVFAKGFDFYLEALASGWIVRVLPEGVARGPHDYAELATPPYQSVTPLAVSTDFAFRAQDAVGWNPRRFRYAGSDAAFRQLMAIYPKVLANDGAAMSQAAELTERQPQGELEILNALMVPGTNDQWRMAAAVASHFATTPHQVVQGVAATPLGRLDEVQFRVKLELPEGVEPTKGMQEEKIPCAVKPTV